MKIKLNLKKKKKLNAIEGIKDDWSAVEGGRGGGKINYGMRKSR